MINYPQLSVIHYQLSIIHSPSSGFMKNRAIFIDRDGTLNEEVGYITEISQFRLFDFAAESIKLINDAGWYAVIITNQAGIARGQYTEEFLRHLHAEMESSLRRRGARLDAIYYCPHHPDFGVPPYRQDCNCRKPKPGLIDKASRDLSLDLKGCYVIGDRVRDVETGHARGSAQRDGDDRLRPRGISGPTRDPDASARSRVRESIGSCSMDSQ